MGVCVLDDLKGIIHYELKDAENFLLLPGTQSSRSHAQHNRKTPYCTCESQNRPQSAVESFTFLNICSKTSSLPITEPQSLCYASGLMPLLLVSRIRRSKFIKLDRACVSGLTHSHALQVNGMHALHYTKSCFTQNVFKLATKDDQN